MKYQVGDEILVLHSNEEGRIIEIAEHGSLGRGLHGDGVLRGLPGGGLGRSLVSSLAVGLHRADARRRRRGGGCCR